MEEHLRVGTAKVSDPVEPTAPASELRCPVLGAEPKSPQSFYCHNCNRAVGGSAEGQASDENLVKQAGPCNRCQKLVCVACYVDRGPCAVTPRWPENNSEVFEAPSTKRLGWVCTQCVPCPSRAAIEISNTNHREFACSQVGCPNRLTKSAGWSAGWNANFRKTPHWLHTTYAGSCTRCGQAFCGECFLHRGPVGKWAPDVARERQAQFWVCSRCESADAGGNGTAARGAESLGVG